jgi:hypothetical protein
MDTALYSVQRFSKICRNQRSVTGKSANTTETITKLDVEFQVIACMLCATTVQDFALQPQTLYICRDNVWGIQGRAVSYCSHKNEWTSYGMVWYSRLHCLKTSLARASVGTQWLHSTINW